MLAPTDVNQILEVFNPKVAPQYRLEQLPDNASFSSWQSSVYALQSAIAFQQSTLCACFGDIFPLDFPPQPDCSNDGWWRPNLAKLSTATNNLPHYQERVNRSNVGTCVLYAGGAPVGGGAITLDLRWDSGCPRISGGVGWSEAEVTKSASVEISVEQPSCKFIISAGIGAQAFYGDIWRFWWHSWPGNQCGLPAEGWEPHYYPMSWGSMLDDLQGSYQFHWLEQIVGGPGYSECAGRQPGSDYFKVVIT